MLPNTDNKYRFKITSNGVALPINSINDYHVYIYSLSGNDKILLAVYKKNNTGQFAIGIDVTLSNAITIVVSRELTRGLVTGSIYAEVMVRLTATSDFVNSVMNNGTTGIVIDKVEVSANPNGML